MCRWMLYLGPDITLEDLLTRPAHSLIHQSYKAELREEPLNGDGFGVAWYMPELSERPAALRSVQPAWSNQNLLSIAPVTQSRSVLAHVRAASPGLPVSELNCHPFVSGKMSFMHNGVVPEFARVRRRLLDQLSDRAFSHVQGSTDSEHVFALLMDHLRATSEDDPLEAMAEAMRRAIIDVLAMLSDLGIRESAQLNLALCDGDRAVVCRFASNGEPPNSLFVHEGLRYVCEDGICRMVEPEGAHHETVLVASEPVSSDPGWNAVFPGEMLLIGADKRVSRRPVLEA